MQLPEYKPNYLKLTRSYLRTFLRDADQFFRRRKTRICPCCGFKGKFVSMRKGRPETRCPNCSTRDRDRLFHFYLHANSHRFQGKQVLHFSPEPYLFHLLKREPGYISADIKRSRYARYRVNVTEIPYPDHHFDYIICHHVLEHVPDDAKALRECHRVLKPGGKAFFSVPMNDTLTETFEPPATMSKKEIERICGWDHKRLYARDIIERIRTAGFQAEEFLLHGEDQERYRTGADPIYVAWK